MYKKDKKVNFQLSNEKNTTLKPEDKEAMDSSITMAEITSAIKSLKRNVTPGVDGLTTEFYQFFWTKIGEMYFSVLNHAFKSSKIHESALRGIVTLIPKKAKILFT